MSAMAKPADGTYATTCWECSTCCGALATVRDGRVVEFAPNRDHPYSKGQFCIKGIRGAPGITYGEKRLLYPMRRTGARGEGAWARISWEEALTEMAERLATVRQKYGAEAIVGATSGAYFSRSLILALTLRSIGSPNWMINQDLCGGCRAVSARVTGLNITRGEDIDNTRCALIVGRNPSIADPVEWAALKAAKKRGARIIVIDPKRTQAAQMADLWLQPHVGTDAALALAMTHVLISENLYDHAFVTRWCHGFDALAARAAQFAPTVVATMTGVTADQIVAAARMYADGPSTFVSGHGIDAFSAGVQTFRAYHCLVAISGNVDRPGGNLRVRTPKGFRSYGDLLHMPQFRLDEATEKRTIGSDKFPLWAGPKGWQTACHNPSVIEAMLSGKPYPVRALYASGVNILITYPNTRRTIEALRSLDFVAVAGHTMTPTAEHADIVLPKTTTLEEEEVSFMPSGPTVLFTRALAPPQGEARCEIDIALPLLQKLTERQAIARHLLPWRSQREFNTYLLGESRNRHRGAGADRLQASQRRAGHARSAAVRLAHRQDRVVFARARGVGARSVAELHGPEPHPPFGAHRTGLSSGARYGRSGKKLSPLAVPRSGVGAEGLARPAAYHAPRDGARLGARRRRLGASRSGARQRRLPAAAQALGCDAAQCGQHGHGMVGSYGASTRARRPRHQYQRGTRL